MNKPFCNKCFRHEAFGKDATFHVWRCMHSTCDKCIKNSHVCPVCGVQSRRTTYAYMASQLQDPIQQFVKFQKICKFKMEQDARLFDFYINKVPTLMEEKDKELEEIRRQIRAQQTEIEKQKKRGEKMKHFMEYNEKNLNGTINSFGTRPSTPSFSTMSRKSMAESAKSAKKHLTNETTFSFF